MKIFVIQEIFDLDQERAYRNEDFIGLSIVYNAPFSIF